MHVLHTLASRNWGGLEHRVLMQVLWLQARGIATTIATPVDGAAYRRAREAGLDVVGIAFGHDWLPGVAWQLRRLMRARGTSVLDCHGNVDSKAALGCRDLAAIVRSVHVTPRIAAGMWRRLKWRHGFDHVICAARSIALPLSTSLALPPARCSVVGEWAEPAFFAAGAADAAPPHVRKNTIDAVIVGMLRPDKGHDVAIAAWQRLASQHRAIRLVIAGAPTSGSDAYARALMAHVRRSGLAATIRFVGYREDVPALLRGSDIVVIPSRREAQSRIAAQAMAVGRPIVASAVGGLPELVEHETTGLLVPVGDAAALASQVARLAGDERLRGRLGAAARDAALRTLSIDRKMAETLAAYDVALRDARNRRRVMSR